MPSTPLHSRRLMFLLPFAPRKDATDGANKAIAQLLAELVVRHRVALVYLRAAEEPPIDRDIAGACEIAEEIRRPAPGRTLGARWVLRWRYLAGICLGRPMWATNWRVSDYGRRARALALRWRPDVIQVDGHFMGQYLSALADVPAPRVLVEYEPGIPAASDRYGAAQGASRVLAGMDLLAWRRFEPAVLKGVQAVVVFTDRDRRALAPWIGRAEIARIPLSVPVPDAPLSPIGAAPPNLLFVGNYVHPPNVDAALRLITAIFPAVKAEHPDVTLSIVGNAPAAAITRHREKDVLVTGRVEDVTPYLDRAAIVVVPLRLGGGMRTKVLEAMAAGKAVVASPLALEGLDVLSDQEVVIAGGDQEFVRAIDGLMRDPQQRAALAARARAWACANLGWSQRAAEYEALYEGLIDGDADVRHAAHG